MELLQKIEKLIRRNITVIEPRYDEVLEVSMRFGITFYDACYVWLALKCCEIFLTEDEKLKKKIEKYVYVKNSSEV